MNLPPIILSKAIPAFLRHCQARSLSQNTLNDYTRTLTTFITLTDDHPIPYYTPQHIEDFLFHLTITPIAGKDRLRAPKTIKNYHIGLSAFWTWAVNKKLATDHILSTIPAPRVHRKPIIPLDNRQVLDLINATTHTKAWHNKALTRTPRYTAVRDRAIILTLIESGVRASELCHLTIETCQFHSSGATLHIINGKGKKDRHIPIGRKATEAISDWLIRHPYENRPLAPLFITVPYRNNRSFDRQALGRLISRLGKKTNIKVSPHRLRTTALCLMAKNGMTAIQLQQIAGHASLTTTHQYIKAAHLNLQAAMRSHSPLDNLTLR